MEMANERGERCATEGLKLQRDLALVLNGWPTTVLMHQYTLTRNALPGEGSIAASMSCMHVSERAPRCMSA